MTAKEDGMNKVIEAQDALIKELAGDLRRVKRDNLRLKLHMQILASTPYCSTASKLRDQYKGAIAGESVLNLN